MAFMRSHRAGIGIVQVLLGVLLLTSLVQAETIPSTYVPPEGGSSGSGAWLRPNTKFYNGNSITKYATKAAACASRGGVLGVDILQGIYDGIPLYATRCNNSSGQTITNIRYYSGTGDVCPTGVTQHAYTCVGACPAGTSLVGSVCTQGTYICPTTGTWTLSSDKQTCMGCWDSSKVPNEDGACVGPADKGAGPACQDPQASSNPPPPWSTSP